MEASDKKRMANAKREIIPGLTLSPRGEVSVDAGLNEPLLDLAECLDDRSKYPVDVQHVVAAIVMARQAEQIEFDQLLDVKDERLIANLQRHINLLFTEHARRLSEDE